MGLFTLALLAVGGLLAGLVIVAVLVAGWEWLRQREMLDSLRRDRAVYAATSPLPLSGETRAGGSTPPASAPRPPGEGAGTASRAVSVVPGQRGPNWIETRPMVLSFAPAVDDETAVRTREPDLRLD